MRSRHPPLVVIAIPFAFVLFTGCASILGTGGWPSPRLTTPDYTILSETCSERPGSLELAQANIAYAKAMKAMERGEVGCVDLFFQAAQFSWYDIQSNAHDHGNCLHELPSSQIYHSALQALIVQGQHHNRFDPRVGLKVQTSDGWINIPCHFDGFSREPEDICSIVTVGDYATSQLNQIYRQKGLGVPAVVQCRSSSQGFQHQQTFFVATLLLRIDQDTTSPGNQPFVLESINPLVYSSVAVNEATLPMAFDTSAALARTLNTTKRNYVKAFLQPGNVVPDEEGLFMLEPYVEGKIPVVLVHGLLSDRLTWANLVNEIRARPWFNDRFQIWGFEYPTGKPFLPSAALLRSQLTQLCQRVDPNDTDDALKQIVLVGHSMGGLISKLQVSNSEDKLWNAISNRRFEDVSMPPRFRERLAESAFFESTSRVNRVVYIGTPHRGSALANRAVGRIGSLLIEQQEEVKLAHRKLLDANPDTFSYEFTRRIPNSLDLLEPDSPLLCAINGLPITSQVHTHSIIGSGRWMLGNGDSDGVVPVSSAIQVTADSEKYVSEKHVDLTRDPSTIDEVLRILREHCQSP
ncbi:MAG: hypothetical protein NTY15_20495 [Planctomycetota bacterium]|nr:hypothetical protein [Planctomycetota bacterium]